VFGGCNSNNMNKHGVKTPQSSASSESKHENMLIALILLMSALLRIGNLGGQSLWIDELITWDIGKMQTLTDVVSWTARNDTYPPGYYIFMFLWMRVFGEGEAMLRLPSAIAGIIAVFYMYKLGRRIYSGKEGLIAATLLSVLYFPIYISQEARAYSILLLAIIAASYHWYVLMDSATISKSRNCRKAIIGYLAWSIIAAYMHYFGVYIIAIHGLLSLVYIFRKRLTVSRFLWMYLPIAVAFAAWIPYLLQGFSMGGNARTDSITPVLFLIFLGYSFGAGKSFHASLGTYSIADITVAVAIASIVALFIIRYSLPLFWSMVKNRTLHMGEADAYLFFWLLVPFLGLMLVNRMLPSVLFVPKYLVICLPAAYLLFARGIIVMLKKAKVEYLIFCVALIFLSVLFFHNQYYSTAHKEQYREAIGFIAEHSDKKTVLIIDDAEVGYKYYFKNIEDSVQAYSYIFNEEKYVSALEYIERTIPQRILLASARINNGGLGAISLRFIEFMENRYIIISKNYWKGIEVWEFQIKKQETPNRR
jgi:mannosyltransferase